METSFQLKEEEKKVEEFYSPPEKSFSAAFSLANNIRFTMGPVEVLKIGEISTTSLNIRREVQLGFAVRTALLTLWGAVAEQPLIAVGQTYKVMCIRATNDFNCQRSYNSTMSTKFEPVSVEEEDVEALLHFEGVVNSVSFENKLVEVGEGLLTVSNAHLGELYPPQSVQCWTIH
ncbi:uncharacterized protein LOC134265081 [Saccostrea cucullata]|uniref:uncharacterized protein LOC134265081 n=1 Tax=Saccostrea cuccullata TaxID=36930 RepID=UPI002ED3F883